MAEAENARATRKAEVIAELDRILDQLTESEFARLSGSGHEVWLRSKLERAVHEVAGRKSGPVTGIRA